MNTCTDKFLEHGELKGQQQNSNLIANVFGERKAFSQKAGGIFDGLLKRTPRVCISLLNQTFIVPICYFCHQLFQTGQEFVI